jgi:hypothetical protein
MKHNRSNLKNILLKLFNFKLYFRIWLLQVILHLFRVFNFRTKKCSNRVNLRLIQVTLYTSVAVGNQNVLVNLV